MDEAKEYAEQIINKTLGNDYKTIYIGRAIEVLNKQFLYKQDIEKLKTEIVGKLDEYAQQVAIGFGNHLKDLKSELKLYYSTTEDQFDKWQNQEG